MEIKDFIGDKDRSMDTYYIDGEFLPADKAFVSVNDLVVLRGFGVFDFLRTYNRRPFHLEEHVERLRNSAELINLPMRWPNDEVCDIVMQTIDKNPYHEECNIRIVITGGISPDSMTPQENQKLLVMITPQNDYPSFWYSEGVKIVTSPDGRDMPGAKSTNYLNAIVALEKARGQNAVEAIYVDKNDRVLEGTTTNLFLFTGDRLVTPDTGILPGITRKVVLRSLKNEFEIETREVKREELVQADEVFITSSNKEIVPVVQLDDMTVGNGKVGERTRKAMELFKTYTTDYGNRRP